MQNIVIHFFLSQEFQSGDPGIAVSKLDSIWVFLAESSVKRESYCVNPQNKDLCPGEF